MTETTTNHMSTRVREQIDTDKIQPDNNLECTSKCPSWVRGKCLVCGFSKTTVECAATKDYAQVDVCSPVFDEIQRQYGEHKARRVKEGTAVRRVTEYTAVYFRLGYVFDKHVTELLSEGWCLRDKLQVHEGCGIQTLTRTHEVLVAGLDEEKKCGHAFTARGNGYVCESCGCSGVSLSGEQLVKSPSLPRIVSTRLYVDTFLS